MSPPYAVALDGSYNTYAFTPSSSAFDSVVDLDVRVWLGTDYYDPPSGSNTLVTSGSWALYAIPGGVALEWYEDDETDRFVVADVGSEFTAGRWLRVTLDVDDGAGGHLVTIYRSSNGAVWTPIATDDAGAFTTSILDWSAGLAIGTTPDVENVGWMGEVRRVRLLDSIGGTVVVDFNPAHAADHTTRTWVSPTGETWTLYGNATLLDSRSVPAAALRAAAEEALAAQSTRIVRRVDIHNPDGSLYLDDVGVVEGQVTVTDGAGARRTCTFTFQADDHALLPDTEGFWFDKTIKAYRGVVVPQYDDLEYLVQVFDGRVSPIGSTHFPRNTVSVAGADMAATLALGKYPEVTLFGAGQTVEAVMASIAAYGGVTQLRVEATARTLGREYAIETDTSLWDAITTVATDHGCEAFFSADGYLVIRNLVPTDEQPTAYTFSDTLVSLAKQTTDSRVYNHVVVRGESSDPEHAAVWAEAENTEPTSPTRISRLGRRTYRYVSPMITTVEQAQTTADALLARVAVLDVEATIGGVVVPWLDAGDVVVVADPNPGPSDPVLGRWQVDGFTVPWALGPTEYTSKRAVRVGS